MVFYKEYYMKNKRPMKMTYPIYLVLKKFGKDLGGMIIDFLFQCDNCSDLEIGPIYACDSCSNGKNLCQNCYDILGIQCYYLPCMKCSYCKFYHCLRHNSFWYDEEERLHMVDY